MRFLETSIQKINNIESGLCSLIWILGEHGEKIEFVPYILENMIENYFEYQSTKIINSLLLASIKLFFKLPGEMQPILGKLFEIIMKNFSDIDLRERTMFYYELLKKDIELAEEIICSDNTEIETCYTELNGETIDKLYNEFNSLSIIYQKPEEKFIKGMYNEEDLKNINKNTSNIDNNNDGYIPEAEENFSGNVESNMNIFDNNSEITPSFGSNNNGKLNSYTLIDYSEDSFTKVEIPDEDYETLWMKYSQK